ncbi:unnamed protein product [Urochloa humidicola]
MAGTKRSRECFEADGAGSFEADGASSFEVVCARSRMAGNKPSRECFEADGATEKDGSKTKEQCGDEA